MNRVLVGVLACAALGLSATGSAASAPTASDLACWHLSWPDLSPESPPGGMMGVVYGGPIMQNGTLRCTVQIGFALHTGADNGASAQITGTNGMTFMSPVVVAYVWPAAPQRYVCSQFFDGTTTWYLDGSALIPSWTANPATPCALV